MNKTNILEKYNLVPSNGYVTSETRTCDIINKKSSKLDAIHLDQQLWIYRIPNEDIYILLELRFNIGAIIFNKQKYTNKSALKIIDNLSSSKNRYLVYNKRHEFFEKIKKIKNTDEIEKSKEVLINQIVGKFKICDDINTNIIFYGKPGTGKSSCVEIFANKLKYDVYMLNIDESLKEAIIEVSKLSEVIILIPELDKHINRQDEKYKEYEQFLLEFLSGAYLPRKSLTIITCNDVKVLESNPIMTRRGRIHYKFEFTAITLETIMNITKKYYPDFKDFSIFNKFIGKVSAAEFKAAMMNSFITNSPPDESFEVEVVEVKKSNHLYI